MSLVSGSCFCCNLFVLNVRLCGFCTGGVLVQLHQTVGLPLSRQQCTMGSGIVFSMGGLPSKQHLKRLWTEERKGGQNVSLTKHMLYYILPGAWLDIFSTDLNLSAVKKWFRSSFCAALGSDCSFQTPNWADHVCVRVCVCLFGPRTTQASRLTQISVSALHRSTWHIFKNYHASRLS